MFSMILSLAIIAIITAIFILEESPSSEGYSFERCLADLNNKELPWLIEKKKDWFSSENFSVGDQWLNEETNFLLLKQFACSIERAKDVDEKSVILAQAQDFLDNVYRPQEMIKETHIDYLKNFSEGSFDTFSASLAFGDLERSCPKLIKQCHEFFEFTKSKGSDILCNDICETMKKLENDKEKTQEQIASLEHLAEYQSQAFVGFFEFLAWRFLGADRALQLCSDFSGTPWGDTSLFLSDLCRQVNSKLEILNGDCGQARERLIKNLCLIQ